MYPSNSVHKVEGGGKHFDAVLTLEVIFPVRKMQKILKHVIYVFLVIFSITAAMCLAAVAFTWWPRAQGTPAQDLPYLDWLVGSVVAEVIGVIVIFAKKGVKYLPDVEIDKSEQDTLRFMQNFISSGSSVTIVSNRVAWLKKSEPIARDIGDMARRGTLLEIITPLPVVPEIKEPLEQAGVKFFVTQETQPPEARFTLVNGQRSGAERLAIARGSHPDHEITIFDNNSGPQIVAMAKDIIRKSKALSEKATANAEALV